MAIKVHLKLSTRYSAVDMVWPELGTAALEATRLWAALSIFRFTVIAAAQVEQVRCRVAQLWEHTFRAWALSTAEHLAILSGNSAFCSLWELVTKGWWLSGWCFDWEYVAHEGTKPAIRTESVWAESMQWHPLQRRLNFWLYVQYAWWKQENIGRNYISSWICFVISHDQAIA